MCELLVRVKDKGSDPDPAKDALISKRGHVIACQPDGWGWTKAERENPDWVIIKIPGTDPGDYMAMMAPAMKSAPLPADGSTMVARRAFSFDLSKLPGVAAADGVIRYADTVLVAAVLDGVKVATPVQVDVEVIG